MAFRPEGVPKKEKEFTRLRDELSRSGRALPREKVEKRYEFRGRRGRKHWRNSSTDKPADRLSRHVGRDVKRDCPAARSGRYLDGAALHLAQRGHDLRG